MPRTSSGTGGDSQTARDDHYTRLITHALETSARYAPALGRGRSGGISLEQFQALYGADPFYSWLGLDSPLMYAAHKAAGGMTSIYRQAGIGCERLLRAVIQDSFGLSSDQASWQYQTIGANNRPRTLKLDGRIRFDDVADATSRDRIEKWFADAAGKLLIDSALLPTLHGAVFEVRQGYKSMDSKRQNADIANASSAYLNRYMPVLLLVSTQIDPALVERYQRERWLILTGTLGGSATESTYAFYREIVRYDLAAFFRRNSSRIRDVTAAVLSTLLRAE